MEETRKCKCCNVLKSINEFKPAPYKKDGAVLKIHRTYDCRDCIRKKNREYLRKKRESKENRIKERERDFNNKLKNPIKKMLNVARKRAKKMGVFYNLKESDLIMPEKCPLLEIPIYISRGLATDNSPSLDRIDNTIGYIPGNVAIISRLANMMKLSASLDQLELFSTNIKSYIRECPTYKNSVNSEEV